MGLIFLSKKTHHPRSTTGRVFEMLHTGFWECFYTHCLACASNLMIFSMMLYISSILWHAMYTVHACGHWSSDCVWLSCCDIRVFTVVIILTLFYFCRVLVLYLCCVMSCNVIYVLSCNVICVLSCNVICVMSFNGKGSIKILCLYLNRFV